MPRVAYVIDHKRPRHDRWAARPVQSATVAELDPVQQAAEIAERYELWKAPVVDGGCEVRVRVWPYETDADLAAVDPGTDQPAGQWTYSLPS